jgi:hypothetical protein
MKLTFGEPEILSGPKFGRVVEVASCLVGPSGYSRRN